MWVFPGCSLERAEEMGIDELLAWHGRAVERKQIDLSATQNAIAALTRAMTGG